jgi:predicted transposase/invertase (TIGR01784 family)
MYEKYSMKDDEIATSIDDALKKGREEGKKEGREEGEKRGREEGREEGEKRTKLDIVQKLLGMGMSIEDISTITCLSKEEIKSCFN